MLGLGPQFGLGIGQLIRVETQFGLELKLGRVWDRQDQLELVWGGGLTIVPQEDLAG